MPSVADRVRETTTTTGTGTVNLGGAVTGFQAFSTAFASGTEVYYCITDGTDWEVGSGAVATGTPWTLARTTLLASSTGSLINWAAGSKDVFCTMPAAQGDARYGPAMYPFNVTPASNLLTGTLASCKIDFRNTSLTTGTPIQYSVTSSMSLAMTSIAGSLGATTGIATRLAWVLVYGAGSPQIAVANVSGGLRTDGTNLITTSAIGAGSTSNTVWYSTSAISTPSQYALLGICDATWTTGVGWGDPTLVQPAGGNALTSMSSIGYGQTWQSVTRAAGTTYYNTTGQPILFAITVVGSSGAGSGGVSVTVNGVIVGTQNYSGPVATLTFALLVVIPIDASYSWSAVSSISSSSATELR